MARMRLIGTTLDDGYRDDLNFNFGLLEALIGESNGLTEALRQEMLEKIYNLQTQIDMLTGENIGELLARLNDAIQQALTAAQEARTAKTATEEATALAIAAKELAIASATLADEKAAYAEGKAILAQEAADNANQEAANLGQMKVAVVQATQDANTATSNANQATEEAQTATNAINAVLPNVTGLENLQEWSSTIAYKKNNFVTFEGNGYMALQNNINIIPPSFPTLSNDDWAMLVQKGEKGEQGTGVRILGTLVNESELPSIGEPGDAYLINGDLYVWSDTTNDWTNVGTIKGPKGDQGIQGPKGDKGDKGDPGEDADVEAINQQIDTLRTEVTEQLDQMKPKVDNSWQKGVYNDTNITNLGYSSASKVFRFTEWDADNSKLDSLYINIPVGRAFSGLIKLTLASDYHIGNAMGGAEIVYNVAKVEDDVFLNTMAINNITPDLARCFYVKPLVSSSARMYIPITKAPNTRNPINIKVEIFSAYDIFSVVNNITLALDPMISQPHPWEPQTPTMLLANTYNPNSTITNIGVNRATRVFPQVNWKAQGIELWESFIYLPASIWGILELDIAGYSSAAGGAKIVIELGINVTSQTGPSSEFRNVMKVVSASSGFTENFYVEVEHRPAARGIFLKIYKRTYNDPVVVSATFTSSGSSLKAFSFLKGFNDGNLYTNIASVPTARQKDFDARITENFTSVSNGKAQVASAITGKGVQTASDATFETMANNINAIPSGKKQTLGTFYMQALSPGQSGSASVNVGFIAQNIMAGCGGLIRLGGTNRFYAQSGSYNVSNIVVSGTTITFTITQGSLAGNSNPANYVEFFASE